MTHANGCCPHDAAPPPAGRLRRWVRAALPAGILIAAALAAYSRTFHVPFLFDDSAGITQNALVISPHVSLRDLLHWQTPVTIASLRINYLLGGLDVRGYHAFNLAVHILGALTLFGLARRTFRSDRLIERFGPAATPLALMVALIWMLHPIQTQAVTYIIQRKESMANLFYLLTLYAFVRGAASQRAGRPRRGAAWFLAAVLACLLGLGSKQTVVTAPLAAVLYDWVFLAPPGRAIRARWWAYLLLAATWGFVLFTSLARLSGEGSGIQSLTRWDYARCQPAALLHYLRLIVLPYGLNFDPGWRVVHGVGTWGPPMAAVLVLAAASVWWWLSRWAAWGFWAIWFFLVLAPTSTVIVITELTWDYRPTLALAGVAMLVVMAGWRLWQRWAAGLSRPRAGVVVTFAAVAGALGAVTLLRNEDYATGIRIWSDAARKNPNNARAFGNLGAELINAGRPDEAIVALNTAIALDPRFVEALKNRGEAYRERADLFPGREGIELLNIAIRDFKQALALRPAFDEAYYCRGVTLLMAAERRGGEREYYEEARADFDRARKVRRAIATDDAQRGGGVFQANLDTRGEYLLALAMRGYADMRLALLQTRPAERTRQLEEALADFDRVVELGPTVWQGYNYRGVCRKLLGRYVEALRDQTTAIALAPANETMPRSDRGHIYRELHRWSEALADYSQAIAIETAGQNVSYRVANTYLSRADVRRRLGDFNGAIDDLTAVLRLEPDHEQALRDRAETYQLMGDLEKAQADLAALVRLQQLHPTNPEHNP